jgi:hypothetical protein
MEYNRWMYCLKKNYKPIDRTEPNWTEPNRLVWFGFIYEKL